MWHAIAGVIAKNRILDIRFATLHGFEKRPDVRSEIIPVITGVHRLLGKRLFSDRRVVLLVHSRTYSARIF